MSVNQYTFEDIFYVGGESVYPMPLIMSRGDQVVLLVKAYSVNPTDKKKQVFKMKNMTYEEPVYHKSNFKNNLNNDFKEKTVIPIAYYTGIFSYLDEYKKDNVISKEGTKIFSN